MVLDLTRDRRCADSSLDMGDRLPPHVRSDRRRASFGESAQSASIQFLPVRNRQPVKQRPAHRAVDVVLASLALLFFAPLMAIIAVAIRLGERGPIFFAQSRVGLGGEEFKCLKFRTMRCDSQSILDTLLSNDPRARIEWARTQKLRVDPRVSRVGSFLRKTSLDELPQLINVLRGEMSMVGPRPIVGSEIERYGHYFRYYCAVKPGLTGLWQISGRNHTTYRRRVACDVSYALRRSIKADVMIMAKTLPVVLLGHGAY